NIWAKRVSNLFNRINWAIYIVRFWSSVEVVILNQYRLSKLTRLAVSKSPFATIAVFGDYVAIHICTSIACGAIRSGAVQSVGQPQDEIARIEDHINDAGGIETAQSHV